MARPRKVDPETGEPTAQRNKTDYLIMQAITVTMADGNEGQAWVPVGEFAGVHQHDAKRKAAAHLNDENADEGAEYTLAAVGVRAWRPITAKLERPAPKLVLS